MACMDCNLPLPTSTTNEPVVVRLEACSYRCSRTTKLAWTTFLFTTFSSDSVPRALCTASLTTSGLLPLDLSGLGKNDSTVVCPSLVVNAHSYTLPLIMPHEDLNLRPRVVGVECRYGPQHIRSAVGSLIR